MSDEKKKPGAAFWTIVVLLCFMLYAASSGPVAWLLGWLDAPEIAFTAWSIAYLPLSLAVAFSGPLSDAMLWYVNLGM